MVNLLKILIFRTVNFYRGSSIKPFGKVFKSIYLKHIEPKMRENRVAVASVSGLKYKLNLNQPSEMETYYGGGYEPAVIRIMEKHLKRGDTAMDIGARIGLHTFRMKKLVGEKGRVLAIEPDQESFSRLVENAELNSCDIVAEKKAFSDQNKDKEITLDDYAIQKNLNKLNFVKLDTDGWEYKIIRGGLKTLKSFKPIMVVECNRGSFENGSLKLMLDLLDSLGYSFFQERSLKKYSDKKAIIDEVSTQRNINILCK